MNLCGIHAIIFSDHPQHWWGQIWPCRPRHSAFQKLGPKKEQIVADWGWAAPHPMAHILSDHLVPWYAWIQLELTNGHRRLFFKKLVNQLIIFLALPVAHGSSWASDQTWATSVTQVTGSLTHWATRERHFYFLFYFIFYWVNMSQFFLYINNYIYLKFYWSIVGSQSCVNFSHTAK